MIFSLTTIVLLVTIRQAHSASQCACASLSLHLRSGPGTSHGIVNTLYPSHCLPYNGQKVTAESYTWLHLNYNGQNVWAASNWLTVKSDCSSHINSGGVVSMEVTDDVQLPGCPRIVRRSEWGARAPKNHIDNMPSTPIYIFLHHGGAGSECFDQASCSHIVRSYQNYHMDSHGWSDIGYNFIVGEDGNAYEGRGWKEIGAHTHGYNTNGIAICAIGDFTSHVPNEAAQKTIKQLIQCAADNHMVVPNYTLKGHRDVGQTACPGTSYYNLIQSWPHYRSGKLLYSP